MKLEQLGKVENCGIFPTPVQRLDNLSREYHYELFVKRDDLTGIGFSGNKIRKLQYLVKDALDKECTALMTYGGIQTNHGRQTAAVAAKYGLKSVVILTMDENDPPRNLSGNLLLDEILGCDLRFMDMSDIHQHSEGKTPDEIKEETILLRRKVANTVVEEYEGRGEKIYEMPAGGSTPVGCAGYIFAVKEIMEQMDAMGIDLRCVVCPSGSQGTFAGLWLGIRYFNAPFEVVGCCVSPHGSVYREKMAGFINEVSHYYEMGIEARADDLDLYCSECAGIGYDVPDEKTYRTIYQLARKEGIFLDPCYTGKGFSGFLRVIEEKRYPEGSALMFLHTGGLPGLFSEQHKDRFSKELWEYQPHRIIREKLDR